MEQSDPDDVPDPRIERVLEYICAHLDEELTVERLSQVSRLSKFHFHRVFTAATGFTVAEFVRLTRLKRASYQLAFEPRRSVLEIALEAGFGSPEAFARAFKEAQGQSPSSFRRAPRWGGRARDQHVPSPVRKTMTFDIIEFEETRVAALEHRGPPATLMQSVARFVEWRKASGASPPASCRTFGIAHDDPQAVAPEAFRFDVCGELRGRLAPNAAGVVEKTIPAGRCAVARHVGSTDAIGDTVRALLATWLPASGEQLRDAPLFFHYISRMPEVPEHEQVTDVYLPLV